MNTFKKSLQLLLSLLLVASAIVAQNKTAPVKGAATGKEAGKESGKDAGVRRFAIVAAESNFTVFVAKAGLLSGIAHDHNIAVKSFSGKVTVPMNDPASGAVEIEADTRSLAVLDQVSEKDRAEITKNMHTYVLESEKFPKLIFRATGLADFKQNGNSATGLMNGDLTLHGVTKRIAIPVVLTLADKSLRAAGQYTLRQTDFGIKPYSAALGTIKVKNEVIVKFNIVAK